MRIQKLRKNNLITKNTVKTDDRKLVIRKNLLENGFLCFEFKPFIFYLVNMKHFATFLFTVKSFMLVMPFSV